MTAPTIINAATAATVPEADLASLVAARLCHDLVSPLGAIGNGVELLEMSGDHPGLANSPELTLIGDSVRAARSRVRYYRMAFGHAPADQRVAVAEIAQLAQGYARDARLTVEVEGGGDASRIETRMLLLALMCMDSAMPWGGKVTVVRKGQGWRLARAAGRPVVWDFRTEDVWQGGEGAPLVAGHPVMEFLLQLHTDMFLGLPGMLFLGAMGLLLVVAVVSGVVMSIRPVKHRSTGPARPGPGSGGPADSRTAGGSDAQ